MMPETGHRCPVPANMSFDSHLAVSHVIATAIVSPRVETPCPRRPSAAHAYH